MRCLIMLVALVSAPAVSYEAAAQTRLKKIVIDPGHGGRDPGALGKKSREKNVVLAVSKRLGELIKDSLTDVECIYTRSTDVFIPLDKRAEIANKNGADLFISIHANSSLTKSVTGAETYVLGLHRSKENLEVAQKENAVITMEDDYTSKYEGFDPTQPESYIMFELMQNVYLEQSIAVASLIQKELQAGGREDRGVKQAGFLVLRQTTMPSVLVELGYISNATEEKFLTGVEGTEVLASAIFRAVKSYKQLYDTQNSPSMVKAEAQKAEEKKVNAWPEGVNIRIQVAASKSEIKVDTLSGLPVTMLEDGETKKYMLGIFTTYEEASAKMKEVKEKYHDCFFVAFDGKEKIAVKTARRKLKK